jgi:hypothetical protein
MVLLFPDAPTARGVEFHTYTCRVNPKGVAVRRAIPVIVARSRKGIDTLYALAWGGPVAQIAMIRQELVEEERWISRERFNRILAVHQVLPGPEAHELCVYFGMRAIIFSTFVGYLGGGPPRALVLTAVVVLTAGTLGMLLLK